MKSPLIIQGRRVTFGGRNALGRYQVAQKPPKMQAVIASFKVERKLHSERGLDGVTRVYVPNNRGTYTAMLVPEFTWHWMNYTV